MPGEHITAIKEFYAAWKMVEGLKENDFFPSPIITPSTKADAGHDEDIALMKSLLKIWQQKMNGKF